MKHVPPQDCSRAFSPGLTQGESDLMLNRDLIGDRIVHSFEQGRNLWSEILLIIGCAGIVVRGFRKLIKLASLPKEYECKWNHDFGPRRP